MEADVLMSWPYQVSDEDIAARIVFIGEPLGKQRPRFTRAGGVYTPSATRAYETALRNLFLAETKFALPDRESRFALRCRFYRSSRQRIDCDNLIKAISDAATKVVWADDSQVMEVVGKLFLCDPNPRAEVLIHRIEDTAPKKKCEVCGKAFVTYPSWESRRHCSNECSSVASRVTLKCPECGVEFTVPRHQTRRNRIYCSKSCGVKSSRRAAGVATPKSRCLVCGAGVSKPKYKICRACFLEATASGDSRTLGSRRVV